MKPRFVLILGLVLLVALSWTGVLTIAQGAEAVARNPLEWLDKLENDLLGSQNQGNLLDRLAQFEEIMVGRVHEGTLVQRLNYLENLLYINQPYDSSVNYKVQALEWVIYKQVFTDSLGKRVERLESTLFGKVFTGPVAHRTEKLVAQVFPEGTVKGHWVSVSEGTLVKVQILDEISSTKSKAGDEFRFRVVETVVNNDLVIIPKGAVGYGRIAKVTRPRNLGIDARLMLDFGEIRALDNTAVSLFFGPKASNMNRSRQLAVGASTAGMLILGPEGILIGMAVKGREKSIPVGTEYYVQVENPVRIYTLRK